MIVATVGMNEAPFDRLLRALERIPPGEELLVQCGSSSVRPANARCVAYLPFDELVGHIRAASTVICHAGVGSVMVALTNGKTPIVVPRLRRFGEAVDDHQLSFARRLADSGLVVLVEDPERLHERNGATPPVVSLSPDSSLLAELREYLLAACGDGAATIS